MGQPPRYAGFGGFRDPSTVCRPVKVARVRTPTERRSPSLRGAQQEPAAVLGFRHGSLVPSRPPP